MTQSVSTKTSATLVLASTSPRRQQLIGLLGLPVEIMPSHADEDTPEGWSPARIVEALARRKAEAVLDRAARTPGAIVVGSDTIVVLDGDVLGKPKDRGDAIAMLTRLAGRGHEVFTGLCCIEASSGRAVVSHSVTRVFMRALTEDQIARYVDSGEPMDKAGAYGIQEIGAMLVDRIEGDFFTVVGLPVSLLASQLGEFGLQLP
ncbi:Maf family protein [Cohnella rhizosphaerae]|uniref:dTTP/UTP pyrophosphatase n=1 Tax=Cohnella rhizosphaerae TaxID=1457232 RepID=A0A9X4KZJ4_9BACL|nr:Maf family protein [Cohnella rhizosphaerae]MDG0813708.1 Maf family protein [Cohnella rhizosphaerae]